MNTSPFTPMEAELLTAFHQQYKAQGFPSLGDLKVRHRENTGNGRYVDFDSAAHVDLPDGYVDLPARYIKMKCLPHGLTVVVLIKEHRVYQLELVVNGNTYWDGSEHDWLLT
jgi:hypothetical protein